MDRIVLCHARQRGLPIDLERICGCEGKICKDTKTVSIRALVTASKVAQPWVEILRKHCLRTGPEI
jgi:hypothetical protein